MGWLGGLVNLFLVLVTGLLLIRIILRLFSANPNTTFVNWIYTTTGDLMAPFRGIFPTPTLGEGYVLDLPAIFALIIYTLIGLLILALLGLLAGPWRRDEAVDDRPVRSSRTRR
jgi:uncharacterized protein YggT (Ycf19 family)